jgi:hypothetical protein
MFMRNRSHTCIPCRTIDKAHHERHKDIAEILCKTYQNRGLGDWIIVPSKFEQRRPKDQDSDSNEGDDMGRMTSKRCKIGLKRQKKNAKALLRSDEQEQGCESGKD